MPIGFETIGARVARLHVLLERREHRADASAADLEHDQHRQPAARRQPAGRDEEQARRSARAKPTIQNHSDHHETQVSVRARPELLDARRGREADPEPEPERRGRASRRRCRAAARRSPRRAPPRRPAATSTEPSTPVVARRTTTFPATTSATSTTSAIRSGAHAHERSPPQPERHVRRLHRLVDDVLQVGPQPVELDLLAQPRAERRPACAARRSGAGRSAGRRRAAPAPAPAGTAPPRRASRPAIARFEPPANDENTRLPREHEPRVRGAEDHGQRAVDERPRDHAVDRRRAGSGASRRRSRPGSRAATRG